MNSNFIASNNSHSSCWDTLANNNQYSNIKAIKKHNYLPTEKSDGLPKVTAISLSDFRGSDPEGHSGRNFYGTVEFFSSSCSLEKKMWKFLTVTILIYFIQPDPRNKYFAHFYECFLKGEINRF